MEKLKLTIESAKELLHKNMQNQNLRRHCYAVGLVLHALYDYYKEQGRETGTLTGDKWEIIGILHDADWELTTQSPEKHTIMLMEWLQDYQTSPELINVFRSHNNPHTNLREPETLLEWSLECCDELTGFIVATALVRPEKSLMSVNVESVLKKFRQKEFARAVNREQIAQCESKLNIPLETFVTIALSAMQRNHEILGL